MYICIRLCVQALIVPWWLWVLCVSQMMLSQAVPTGDPEDAIHYGAGLFVMDLSDEGMGRVWGHDGWGNAYMFYMERDRIAMTGSMNQQEMGADWYEPTEKALRLLLQERAAAKKQAKGGNKAEEGQEEQIGRAHV